MLKTWAGFKITMAAPNCSLSDGLGQRLFSFLSLAARISHARHCAAAPFLETNIQSERLNLFKKKDLMFVSRNSGAAYFCVQLIRASELRKRRASA